MIQRGLCPLDSTGSYGAEHLEAEYYRRLRERDAELDRLIAERSRKQPLKLAPKLVPVYASDDVIALFAKRRQRGRERAAAYRSRQANGGAA